MTVEEAVQLVIQAGAIGEDGEVMILDMGEPVKIVDVARQLIAMSGKNIEIVYTGLRDGEKLHEELFGATESDERSKHPLVSHAHVAPLSLDVVRSFDLGMPTTSGCSRRSRTGCTRPSPPGAGAGARPRQ